MVIFNKIKNKDTTTWNLLETDFKYKDTEKLKVKEQKKVQLKTFFRRRLKWQLISNKVTFKIRNVTKNKELH